MYLIDTDELRLLFNKVYLLVVEQMNFILKTWSFLVLTIIFRKFYWY